MGNLCCACASTESTSQKFTRDQSTQGTTHDGASTSTGNCRPSASESREEAFPDGQILPTPDLKFLSFSDLMTATQNFKSENMIGEGGFGTVFKGVVHEKTLGPCKAGTGMAVAIKKLKPESMQGFKEYQSELKLLGRRSHPNIVKLLGHCWEDTQMLLVYEYMQKGSLENHLFGNRNHAGSLTWQRRLKIAIGAARGLAFLHSSDEQVIYRDFKASNILLDGDYNAKISDFGLARLGPSGEASHVTTSVKGTYGYAAPEYIKTGRLYVKSDVYSFGVVLLEMLTGLRALDGKRPSGQEHLVEWATPSLSSMAKLKTIMDSRLEGQYSSDAAMEAAQLTLQCTRLDREARPSMKEVVEALKKIEAMSTEIYQSS